MKTDTNTNAIELTADVVHEGFRDSHLHVLSTQEFNVVCVTKRDHPNGICKFHLPIKGKAVVKQVVATRGDISIAFTTVTFNGKEYRFSHVRPGLSGSVLVIGVVNSDEKPFNEWELYTDTPTAISWSGQRK